VSEQKKMKVKRVRNLVNLTLLPKAKAMQSLTLQNKKQQLCSPYIVKLNLVTARISVVEASAAFKTMIHIVQCGVWSGNRMPIMTI
jgi:hypothetical protein